MEKHAHKCQDDLFPVYPNPRHPVQFILYKKSSDANARNEQQFCISETIKCNKIFEIITAPGFLTVGLEVCGMYMWRYF